MLNSKKIAATAGVLWSLALIGAGSAQAIGHDGSDKCVDDGKGTVRCVQKTEYSGDESVKIVNKNTCKSVQDDKGTAHFACVGTSTINGKKV
ncbi:hypothetical protein ACFWWT_35285 [Streptomyces sp. NPDC058676]|uniref:hypothetical protein n=1 Tax=unclassified Streptomyces TaxID=2593676 RepID=UPI003660D914